MSDVSEKNTVVMGGYKLYGEQKPRLIDANKCLVNQYTLVNKSVEFTAGFHGALQFMVNRIENAPTVDAISVEWLENKLNALCSEAMGAGALYGDRIGELTKSINEVIKLWQEEK